ncbi:Hydrophobin-1 [Trametes pubescens]|uniref:Hydrophobin n=1 Tax=Trametes pubescens TaxID=154538 RepID=A0A1M2W5G6_TRAPU|nr:Hydrophobin-1 [Trametes pubescens]
MKYTLALFLFAFIVATVQAASLGTNAERLARGLPPRSPTRLYNANARDVANKPKPSGKPQPPSSCSTGPVQCCNSVEKASNPVASILLGLLGIVLGPDVVVGLTCSPISVIGVGSGSCSANTVCCENNSHGGLISIGCIPNDLCGLSNVIGWSRVVGDFKLKLSI